MNDMDAKLSALVAKQYKDYIVGFKVAHFQGLSGHLLTGQWRQANLLTFPLWLTLVLALRLFPLKNCI